jgi:hypothetical protein
VRNAGCEPQHARAVVVVSCSSGTATQGSASGVMPFAEHTGSHARDGFTLIFRRLLSGPGFRDQRCGRKAKVALSDAAIEERRAVGIS